MPKQKGFIKLQGKLNGLSYYQLYGEYLKRVATGPSKDTIQNNPAYVKVKSNNQEFGCGSKLSKAIRTGFLETAKQFQDSKMASRLSGVCRKIIQKGSGSLGQRDAHISNDPEALIGFQINKYKHFNKIHLAKPVVTSNNNRSLITITIPKSTSKHLKRPPKTATHMQFTAALSMVSKYLWDNELQKYSPVALKYNGKGTSQQTVPLVCKANHTNIQIQLQTPLATSIPEQVAITVWLGISYGKLKHQEFVPFKAAKAMQCIAVC